jgi:hypothetical protein
MKKTLLVGMMVAVAGVASYAEDTNSPGTTTGGSATTGGFTAGSLKTFPERKFEAGLILGEPTGASLKYWLSDTFAVDGAVGWSFHDETDLHLHSDVLWHNFDVFDVSKGQLPLYVGVGARVKFRDNRDDLVGIRVPVGINYLFENSPVSLFLEVAPVIDVAPSVRGGFTAGIGARFRF